MSQRHADMEDAGRVPVSWPSAGLSVEEMAAPTRRGSDIPEPSSAPSSAPEESGVFVRKAKPVGGEIAPRHQKHYSEVERLGPDTFLGHGQAPSGPNVPSVIDEIDEEPSRGEMVAQKAQHDTIAASSRRKPKAA